MENLSPKEIYEKQKQEKLSGEARKQKIKSIKRLLVLIVVLVVVFGGVYLAVKKSQRKIASRKIFAVKITDQGRDHIAIGASHPVYNSNPPVSGWHYEKEADRGVYNKQLPDEQLIHNLEHGYIWISYRPDASPEIIKQLSGFYGLGSKIIVEPRIGNDQLIALAAWGWLDKFDSQSKESLNNEELKRISDFIDTYIGQGPEPNAN